MRPSLVVALLFTLLLCVSGIAHADCSALTMKSFTLSPNVISGDQSDFATGTASVCLPNSMAYLVLNIWENYFSATQIICDGGFAVSGGACVYPGIGPGDGTATFHINGYNYGTTDANGLVSVNLWGPETLATADLTVTAVGDPYEPPDQDPDGPCPNCGNAGNPINVTNGDTWIPQQDYSIPGLGGGLTLTRTWNSLWANMNPPEQAGIFSDSWRSNFEERIQLITGGAKYWKGNGSSQFYSFDSLSGTYSLSAPPTSTPPSSSIRLRATGSLPKKLARNEPSIPPATSPVSQTAMETRSAST